MNVVGLFDVKNNRLIYFYLILIAVVIMLAKCNALGSIFRMLKQLRLDFAGRHGPVKDKHIYDVMCRSEGFFHC